MLYVEKNGTIRLTRGDTAYLTVPIMNKVTGEAYEMQPEDQLVFSVKASVKDTAMCFQKVSVGSNSFKILPEDTEGCDFANYKYDVQLVTKDGDVFTVIEPSNLQILPEVG